MLGTNIKNARKKLNLTQRELALSADIATITLRKYESGEREPNLKTIEKLAYILGVSPYELLSDTPKTSSFEHKDITNTANNLLLLTSIPDTKIHVLAENLEILVQNVTDNITNRHDVPSDWFDYTDYVDGMNKLLNKLCIVANPVGYIDDPQHKEIIKAIDDFIGYKLNQFNEEQER